MAASAPFEESLDSWKEAALYVWNAFLDAWPLDRLKSMKLDEYMIGGGDRKNFSWWIEFGTRNFCSMSGGASNKFLFWKNRKTLQVQTIKQFEGKDSETVFHNEILSEIVAIAQAARNRDIRQLSELEAQTVFGTAVFWKIALLYQPQSEPFLLPAVSGRAIQRIYGLEQAPKKIAHLQQDFVEKVFNDHVDATSYWPTAYRETAPLIDWKPESPYSGAGHKIQHPTYWLVGANDEPTAQAFIAANRWQHFFDETHTTERKKVLEMKVGDRIAIKAVSVRKYGLPFFNHDKSVSCMTIKAIGTITKASDEGVSVAVAWEKDFEPKTWYFSTYQTAINKLDPTQELKNALIRFIFNDEEQDIDLFLSLPQWSHYSRSSTPGWTAFYTDLASAIAAYDSKRNDLTARINRIVVDENLTYLHDLDEAGHSVLFEELDPFTIFAIFNRFQTLENRRRLASALCNALELDLVVPDEMDGIPLMIPQNSRFIAQSDKRHKDDVNQLWQVFMTALRYAQDRENGRAAFVESFDAARAIFGIKWNLTIGLFWIAPETFLTLESHTREYLKNTFPELRTPTDLPDAASYLDFLEQLSDILEDQTDEPQSFVQISSLAWKALDFKPDAKSEVQRDEIPNSELQPEGSLPYGIDSIAGEGCFLETDELETMLRRLDEKKNIILQGAPGTGKTWLAKRLGKALIGFNKPKNIRSVQFHANMTYEDFVRGLRPTADGRFELQDGPFMQLVETARAKPNEKFVFVIEEINRGNPSKIFGELLTLLEAGKRNPSSALELTYRKNAGEAVYLPTNLYVIGTMNIADRSLAIVDLALRRRFAFITLKPAINDRWADYLRTNFNATAEDIAFVSQKMTALNQTIAEDVSLGKNFVVGQSFVTPTDALRSSYKAWFKDVVETELRPLLEEYWFDDIDKVEDVYKQLTEGF